MRKRLLAGVWGPPGFRGLNVSAEAEVQFWWPEPAFLFQTETTAGRGAPGRCQACIKQAPERRTWCGWRTVIVKRG